MLLAGINGRENFVFAFSRKFETFQNRSYPDKRKHSVLEVNAEEHSSFNKVLKENKELKARTDSFRKKYKMRQGSERLKYFGDRQQRNACYHNCLN